MAEVKTSCAVGDATPQTCEVCGAPATIFLTDVCVVSSDPSQTTSTSRSLCVRCGRAEGTYPSLWTRVRSRVMQAALRPFAAILWRRMARKHPEMWAELERQRREMRGQA